MPRSLAAKMLAERCQNDGKPLTCGQKAMRLGFSKTLVSLVQNGERSPSEAIRAACLAQYGIPLGLWNEPDPELANAEPQEPTPPSGPREITDEPLLPGQTLEKLRRSAARTERMLRSPSLSTSQAAALEGRHQAALIAIQRIELEGALEHHPDFADFMADIRGAIKDAFGDALTPERMRVLSDSMRKRGKTLKRSEAA